MRRSPSETRMFSVVFSVPVESQDAISWKPYVSLFAKCCDENFVNLHFYAVFARVSFKAVARDVSLEPTVGIGPEETSVF